MGATSQLSKRATGPALECRTQEQKEAVVHVNHSLADLAGKYDTRSNLAGTEAASTHGSGPDTGPPIVRYFVFY